MTNNSRENRRRQRMDAIVRWVDAVKGTENLISKKKLISESCIEFGCTRRTALEYINTLEDAGRIEL